MRRKRYLFLAGIVVCVLLAAFCFWRFRTTEVDIPSSRETITVSGVDGDIAERVERALALSAEVIAAGRSNLGDLDGEAKRDVLLAIDRLTVGREVLLKTLRESSPDGGAEGVNSEVEYVLEDLEGILSEYIR